MVCAMVKYRAVCYGDRCASWDYAVQTCRSPAIIIEVDNGVPLSITSLPGS